MIDDATLQADLVYKIKGIVTGSVYYGILTGTPNGGVREIQYQADSFVYPNIRLDLEDNIYFWDEQEKCGLQQIDYSVYVFSEQRSSKECSQIKGMLATALVGLGFTGITLGTKYTRSRLIDSIPAIRESEVIWRSQIKLRSRVQQSP